MGPPLPLQDQRQQFQKALRYVQRARRIIHALCQDQSPQLRSMIDAEMEHFQRTVADFGCEVFYVGTVSCNPER